MTNLDSIISELKSEGRDGFCFHSLKRGKITYTNSDYEVRFNPSATSDYGISEMIQSLRYEEGLQIYSYELGYFIYEEDV